MPRPITNSKTEHQQWRSAERKNSFATPTTIDETQTNILKLRKTVTSQEYWI